MYEQQAQRAFNLIKKKGTNIPISRPINRTFNSTTQEYEGSDTEDGTLLAVIFPVSFAFAGTKVGREFASELVRSDTRTLLASAKGSTYEPIIGDEVEFDNKTWSVLGCDTLAPDDDVKILYNLVVKVTN